MVGSNPIACAVPFRRRFAPFHARSTRLGGVTRSDHAIRLPGTCVVLTDEPGRIATSPAHCAQCDAVCCRLTVVLQPEEHLPAHLTTYLPGGLRVMARDEEGWCVALDSARMNCGIYDSRPDVCRRFVMDGPYCRAVRQEYVEQHDRPIPLILR